MRGNKGEIKGEGNGVSERQSKGRNVDVRLFDAATLPTVVKNILEQTVGKRRSKGKILRQQANEAAAIVVFVNTYKEMMQILISEFEEGERYYVLEEYETGTPWHSGRLI